LAEGLETADREARASGVNARRLKRVTIPRQSLIQICTRRFDPHLGTEVAARSSFTSSRRRSMKGAPLATARPPMRLEAGPSAPWRIFLERPLVPGVGAEAPGDV